MDSMPRSCWCGATTAIVRHHLQPAPDEEYQLLECKGCGVFVLDPQPSESQLRRWYLTDYYGRTPRKFVGPIASFVGVFQRSRARRITRLITPPARLLDVGCGNGGFLLHMKRRGWHVEGTEWTAESAARVPSDSGIPIHIGDLTMLDPPAESYDAVTLWHVLEHLRNPQQTLTIIRRLLTKRGRLIVALPNAESPQARRYGANWFHLDPPRHLFGFGPHSLQRLLDRCGYEIESRTTFSLEQNPFGLIQSLLNTWGFPRDRAYAMLKGISQATMASHVIDLLLVAGLAFPAILIDLWESSQGQGATLTVVAKVRP